MRTSIIRYIVTLALVALIGGLGVLTSGGQALLASSVQPAPLRLSAAGAPALSVQWARGHVNPALAGSAGQLLMQNGLMISRFGVQPGGSVNASFVVPSIKPGRYTLRGVVGSRTVLAGSFRVNSTSPPPSPHVTVQVDRSSVLGVSRLNTGISFTQLAPDSWGEPQAVARGRDLLAASSTYANQHIYGWGAANPEPSRGVFDWASLDARIDMLRSMHQKIVITLCCAPDWMTSFGTDTSTYQLNAPTPSHYGDFANLAKKIAQRYPDVKYFQVWNELKGFWDEKANTWNAVQYTAFYNRVYDALKSVNPAIKVGGPYIVLEGSGTNLGDIFEAPPITARNMAFLKYWLAHKHGADYITLDRTAKADKDPHRYTKAQMLEFPAQFEAIADEIHAITPLPVWWAEERFEGGAWNYQAAGLSTIMYYELLGNSAVSLSWQPMGRANNVHRGNYQNLISDARVPGGGHPFPYYYAFLDFHTYFPPGTKLYRTTVSTHDVLALASHDHVLIINDRPSTVSISLNGKYFQMAGYTIKLVALG